MAISDATDCVTEYRRRVSVVNFGEDRGGPHRLSDGVVIVAHKRIAHFPTNSSRKYPDSLREDEIYRSTDISIVHATHNR